MQCVVVCTKVCVCARVCVRATSDVCIMCVTSQHVHKDHWSDACFPLSLCAQPNRPTSSPLPRATGAAGTGCAAWVPFSGDSGDPTNPICAGSSDDVLRCKCIETTHDRAVHKRLPLQRVPRWGHRSIDAQCERANEGRGVDLEVLQEVVAWGTKSVMLCIRGSNIHAHPGTLRCCSEMLTRQHHRRRPRRPRRPRLMRAATPCTGR